MTRLPLTSLLYCSRCHYDLRGRALTSRCPGCHHPVQNSLESFNRLMNPKNATLLNITALHTFLLGTAPAWAVIAMIGFQIHDPFSALTSLSVLAIAGILLWQTIARRIFIEPRSRFQLICHGPMILMIAA